MLNIINETDQTVLAAIMLHSLLCYRVKKIPFSFTSKHSPDTSYKKVRGLLHSFLLEHAPDYHDRFASLANYKPQELFNAASDPELSSEISSLLEGYPFNKLIAAVEPYITENFHKNELLIKQYLPPLLKALGMSEDITLYLNFIPINLLSGAHSNTDKPSFCIGYYEFYLKYMKYDVLLHEMCHALINTFMAELSSTTTILPYEVYENKPFKNIHVFQSEVLARIFTAFMMQRGQLPDYTKALKFYEFMGWQKITRAYSAFDLLVRNKAYDIIADRDALIENLSVL